MQVIVWTDIWKVNEREEKFRVSVKNDVNRCCLQSAFLLLEFNRIAQLSSLDISGCKSLDVTSVIDLSDAIPNLEYFICRGCEQVTEYHLVRIADVFPTLIYIDGAGAGKVTSTVATGILYNLKKLSKLSVEINESAEEVGFWLKLIWQFEKNVVFGASIRAALPHNGNVANYVKKVCGEA